MKKTAEKNSTQKQSVVTSGAMFLSFCRALDRYCDEIGVINRRFSAVRILHDAACNTVSQMSVVTIAQQRHMARMERNIPQMFAGLIEMSQTDGFINTVDRMSAMSLAQVSDAITQKSRGR